jgi:hypothetical protein
MGRLIVFQVKLPTANWLSQGEAAYPTLLQFAVGEGQRIIEQDKRVSNVRKILCILYIWMQGVCSSPLYGKGKSKFVPVHFRFK